jgi:hypothetical protein
MLGKPFQLILCPFLSLKAIVAHSACLIGHFAEVFQQQLRTATRGVLYVMRYGAGFFQVTLFAHFQLLRIEWQACCIVAGRKKRQLWLVFLLIVNHDVELLQPGQVGLYILYGGMQLFGQCIFRDSQKVGK